MKRTLTLLLLTSVVISAGVYTYLRQPDIVPEVRTATVSTGDIIDSVGATGALEAVTTVQVGSQVSGKIQELYADFNSIVRTDEVIARLDPSLFETQVEQSKANLIRAQADVERLTIAIDDAETKLARAEGLSARSLIPASELEAAQVEARLAEAQLRSSRAQMTQAEASLNQANVNLEHTIITSPIDGIVISRSVDVGQTVAASMQAPILFLLAADLTKMKVNANIDESDVGRIRPGQVVTFRVDAYPDSEFEGLVSQVRLEPIVVENVVTYATQIDVPNPDLRLKPGMTATVTLEIARRNDALRIPNAALRFRPTDDMFVALSQPVPEQPEVGRSDGQGSRPEGRRQMMERFQNMSEEERTTMREQFGGRPSQGGVGEQANVSGRRRPRPVATDTIPATERGATTIDALFGPLPETVTRGQVWLYASGDVKPTALRLGITDGAFTELLDPAIPPGTELITNISLAAGALTRPTGQTNSPLIPQRRSFFGR
ncbi:MAG: efflux RND transporter periplasmic adaptor subunit [Vicinamibacterales bacterium]|jgi:HlyD family secretion protein|nr:efflux RND transporter periplasmic adaptor subunit [Vicinamibacterales bacterium]HJO17920.1 efflux RND transporter periplasmic adaptor subunit [Vicinamibacterales bacterium]|tara:strand:+ start:6962 stop:8437 length:1476 start_codon:yes stop_codon:yes gene_type:complete